MYNRWVAEQRRESEGSRAAARKAWPVRAYRLGAEPADDLRDSTTPEQRVAMVWSLTLEAWSHSGKPLPDYSRADSPVRRFRREPS